MDKLTILKIGGNVIDNAMELDKFLDEFETIDGRKILVHGGGKIATKIAESLGYKAVMIDGRRVTDSNMRDVVTMVYGGLVNKKIVSQLQSKGVNAIGLCGADGHLIEAKIRSKTPIDYGFVGDPVVVNKNLVKILIESGLVIVVAPLTLDYENGLLNTNADTMAQTVAVAMADQYDVDLIYKFELDGVLSDITDPDSIIKLIDHSRFEELKNQKIVAGGMLPKIDNALSAVDQGVKSVYIGKTQIKNSK